MKGLENCARIETMGFGEKTPGPLPAPPGVRDGSSTSNRTGRPLDRPQEKSPLSDLIETATEFPELQKTIITEWAREFNTSVKMMATGRAPKRDVLVLVHILTKDTGADAHELASLLKYPSINEAVNLVTEAKKKSANAEDIGFVVRANSVRWHVRQQWKDISNVRAESEIARNVKENGVEHKSAYTPGQVLDAVTSATKITLVDLKKHLPKRSGRDLVVTNARTVAAYLIVRLVYKDNPYGQETFIAKLFDREHSTISYYVDKVSEIVQKKDVHHPLYEMLVAVSNELGLDDVLTLEQSLNHESDQT